MLKDDIEKQEVQALSQKDSQHTNHKIDLVFHDLLDVLSDKKSDACVDIFHTNLPEW